MAPLLVVAGVGGFDVGLFDEGFLRHAGVGLAHVSGQRQRQQMLAVGLRTGQGERGQRVLLVGSQLGKQSRRWGGVGRFQPLTGHLQGRRIGTAVLGEGFVQALGDRLKVLQQLLAPVLQRTQAAITLLQRQPGFATALGHGVPVGGLGGRDLRAVGRAVGQQAVQQEDVEEADGLGRDADGAEGIQVHQPHFDILHAPGSQRGQRPFLRTDGLLGTDGAVELVLDLKQRRG